MLQTVEVDIRLGTLGNVLHQILGFFIGFELISSVVLQALSSPGRGIWEWQAQE
jgi:hypothetical protein